LFIKRKHEDLTPPNVKVVTGDLLVPSSLKQLLSPGCSVINLAYLWSSSRRANLLAANNLALACREARVRRLIHCSTAVVVGRISGVTVTEETECRPFSEYEITKLAIEEHLLRQSKDYYETVILRPTVVFGPGGKNLIKVVQDIIQNNWITSYFRTSLFKKRMMNLVSVRNVVAAMLFLLKDERNLNREIFIISDDDDEYNNYAYLRHLIMKRWGIAESPIPIIPFPRTVEGLIFRLFKKSSLNQSRVYSSGKLALLGYKKPASFCDELEAYLNWHEKVFSVRN